MIAVLARQFIAENKISFPYILSFRDENMARLIALWKWEQPVFFASTVCACLPKTTVH
jgi:hypothetical protein